MLRRLLLFARADSGALWSNTWQPTTKPAKAYEAIFTQARAEFRRADDQIETYTQISVSPEDDIELRRVTLTNRSETPRTSRSPVTRSRPGDQPQDEASGIQQSVRADRADSQPPGDLLHAPTALGRRRPPWMMHMMTVRGPAVGEPSYETDRMRFIGRQRTLALPAALEVRRTFRTVKDPCSIRSLASARPC